MDERSELLTKLQSYKFALVELNLYLDTHPEDRRALDMFKALAKKYRVILAEYEDKYGAMTADRVMSDDYWTWINSPWPWENI